MEPIVQQPASEPRLTYQQFLEFVADKEERYEFVDGHAVAMGISPTGWPVISRVSLAEFC